MHITHNLIAYECLGVHAITTCFHCFVLEFSSLKIQMSRNKTMLCPALSKPEGCTKVPICPYAHTEEERKRYEYI